MSFWSIQVNSRLWPSLLMALTAVFIVGCKVDNSLVDAVLTQGQLDKFKSRDISHLAASYIPVGTDRKKAMDLLRQHGFDVKEEKRSIPGCTHCDPLVISGTYVEKRFLPFLPDKSSISILLGCREDKVTHVAASHSPNPF
ncbi:MAG: hypothetical protein IE913_10715 [Halothiobacillus sp.]|nr:hypothetical protein [Halothiobacillus sp.]